VNTPIHGSSCNGFFEYAVEQAFHSDVDTVVFGAFWEEYFLGEFSTDHRLHPLYSVRDPLRTPLELNSRDTELAFDGFQDVVTKLVSSGRRVFIVLSNPTSPLFNPTSMLSAEVRLALHTPASILVGEHRRSIDPGPFEAFVAPAMTRLRELAAQSGAKILDPRDSLCEATLCAAVAADGMPLYKDSNHLRPFFARERASFLDPILLGPPADAGSIPGRSHASEPKAP
jgi:hypothetical protein